MCGLRSVLGDIGFLVYDLFHFMGKLPAGEHDSAVALAAFQPDISAKPHHFPGVAAAGVGFLHLDDIFQFQIRQHDRIITHVIIRPSDGI